MWPECFGQLSRESVNTGPGAAGRARRPPPLRVSPNPGKSRRGGERPAWPRASSWARRPRARAPGGQADPTLPASFPADDVQVRPERPPRPGPPLGAGVSGPPGTLLGPEGPRCPLPPAPRPAAPSPRPPEAATTRSPTAGAVGGRSPRPALPSAPPPRRTRPPPRPGPAVGRSRSPAVVRLQADAAAAPVHLAAGPAGHGALRRPPSAPHPGRSGHGAGPQRPDRGAGEADGGTRKGARGAGTERHGSSQLRGTWRQAGRGLVVNFK